jgi:hypothetical protein
MKLGPILSPVHQSHQQLIGPAQFRRSPEITHPFLYYFEHPFNGFSLYAGQPLEIRAL